MEDHRQLLPAYSGLVGGETNQEILKIITQGQHIAKMKNWEYEFRRQFQHVLPFLCLGPSSATRNTDVLKQEGITMLLVIRDTMSATAKLMSGEKAAIQLGIEAAAVDVSGNPELIKSFDRAIDTINNHLISMYRQRSMYEADPETTTWGKVLIFCEYGNERSAAVVAAYFHGYVYISIWSAPYSISSHSASVLHSMMA